MRGLTLLTTASRVASMYGRERRSRALTLSDRPSELLAGGCFGLDRCVAFVDEPELDDAGATDQRVDPVGENAQTPRREGHEVVGAACEFGRKSAEPDSERCRDG